MKEPAIVFKDFSFQYKVQHEPTLHDINLTIYKGEKVLILGSSGSGKSTLANCINGLIPFSHHGTCLLYTSPSPRDLRISRMPSSA